MATIIKLRDEGKLVTSRECFLSEDDVRNVCGLLQKDLYMKHSNDAESVRMWVRENPNLVFYYQDPGVVVDGAIMADNMPFVIAIQTAFQFRTMLQYGHESAIAIDATFATNDTKVLPLYQHDCSIPGKFSMGTIVEKTSVLTMRFVSPQFPLFTMMVFDEWQNGVPIAFVIIARQKQSDLAPWMQKLKDRLLAAKADWHPNAFILDDANNEINSLRSESKNPNFSYRDRPRCPVADD
jgi:hypothetical protein